MTALLKKYLKGDVILWVVFIGLCIISAVVMFSASSTLAYKNVSHSAPMLRHATFLFFGAVIAFLVHLLPYKAIRIAAYVGLILSVITLLMALTSSSGIRANDASRWVSVGGFQFQPSEIAKLSLIILAADMIARIKDSIVNEKKYFRMLMIITGLLCLLILPENFSTAILLFGVIFVMMFIGKVSGKKLAMLAGGILVAGVLTVLFIEIIPEEKTPSVMHRFYTWESRIKQKFLADDNPENAYVINDDNLQVMHGKIAIARGGVTGVLPGNSVQRDFLPQAYSDFIYAIIVEELGLIGGIVVILLYMTLLFRAGRIATLSRTVFPALLVIGLSLMIVTQAFVSMAVATSLGPVTGQPLPLISRGGTSILITSIYFGILLGVTRQIKEQVNPEDEPLEVVILEEEE